jgi:hypothetical protein
MESIWKFEYMIVLLLKVGHTWASLFGEESSYYNWEVIVMHTLFIAFQNKNVMHRTHHVIKILL